VNDVLLFGPEVAFAWGPLWLFGEYNRARIDRGMGQGQLDFQSGHVGAAWALTGESRSSGYKMSQGKFKRLNPESPFRFGSDPGAGAWEVAVRYAYLDVTDRDIRGGEQGNLSTALNWYPNYNVRMMLEWDRVLQARRGTATTNTAEGLDIVTFRVQFNF
jgi:phosphate-selective porin OprO/OprP